MANGNTTGMTYLKKLGANDVFLDTQELTVGLFNGAGTFLGGNMETSSISSSNHAYYHTIRDKSQTGTVDYWDVSFGHKYASGSVIPAGGLNSSLKETQVMYSQFANVVLDDPFTGFTFSDVSGSDTGTVEDYIYTMTAKTDKLKNELDSKCTITFTGSLANGAKKSLVLTTYTGSTYGSPGGQFYKMISGSNGVEYGTDGTAGFGTTYGHFYPDHGLFIFAGSKLSASLPGVSGSKTGYDSAAKGSHSGSAQYPMTGLGSGKWGQGFAPYFPATAGAKNHYKLLHCLRSGSMVVRTRQHLNQTTIYVRVHHGDFNASSNPTWYVNGSEYNDIKPEFVGNPTTFITGIGLYNADKDLVAVAKLNKPVKNTPNSEFTGVVTLQG
tara:strand:+ start:35668 stop:36816 length:1149 start_codon:yes stop_codon:yes gene_type:complete